MKRVIIFILLAGLLVNVAGCGLLQKAKQFKDGLDEFGNIVDNINDNDWFNDDDDNDDDYGDDDNQGQSAFGGVVWYPGDSFEILNRFQEFGYVWEETLEDGSPNNFSLHYRSEDDIDGTVIYNVSTTETNKEDKIFKLWFDSEGKCIKAMKGDEELESWEGSILTMLVQLYVNYAKLTTTIIDADGRVEDFSYSLGDKWTEGSEFGTVEMLEVHSKLLPVTSTFGLVPVDGELFFIKIKHDTNGSNAVKELRVTHLVGK